MHRIFSNFAYILLLKMSGMGLLMGKIRPFSMELLPFLPLKNGFWPVFLLLAVYDIWMKLHRYVEQQRLHITRKDRHSYLSSSWVICPWLILSISVLLLFRHYISHKITFGAPSSGGVLCSACGAFIFLIDNPIHIWYNNYGIVHFVALWVAIIK